MKVLHDFLGKATTRVHLLLFIALFSGLHSFAQLSTINSLKQHPITLNSPQNGIIHSIAVYPEMALSYYEYTVISGTPPVAELRGDFVVNDGGTNGYSITLPSKIYATDFVQVANKQLVVFCGYKDQSVSSPQRAGVIGYLDFSTNPVQMYYTIIDTVYQFNKVQAHIDVNGLSRVVSIGKLPGNYHSIIYSIDDIISLSTLPSGSWKKHLVHPAVEYAEIVSTENYFVFVGYHNVEESLCLQREYHAGMSSPSLLSNIHCFKLADDDRVARIHATYVGNRLSPSGDVIMVSTPTVFSSSSQEYRFRTIDVSSLMPLSTQYIYGRTKADTWDMTYVESANKVCVLLGVDPSSGMSVTCGALLDPYSTVVYTAPTLLEKDHYLKTVDCLNVTPSSARHVIFGEPSFWYLKDVTNLPGSCDNVSSVTVKPIDNPDYITEYYSNPGSDSGIPLRQNLSRTQLTIITDCINTIRVR